MIDDNDIIELTKVKNKLDEMIEKVSNIPKINEENFVKEKLIARIDKNNDEAYVDFAAFLCLTNYYDFLNLPKGNSVDTNIKILCKLFLNNTINIVQFLDAIENLAVDAMNEGDITSNSPIQNIGQNFKEKVSVLKNTHKTIKRFNAKPVNRC